MLFNSFDFIYFLLIVFPLFYLVPQRFRWILLLIASYYFYMCWDYSYVILILFTTATSYFAAIGIENTTNVKRKKTYLYGSIIASLSILFFFKYYDFFVKTVNDVTSGDYLLLNFLLPVGISFYTFETLSYTIDVYKDKLKAERNFGIYALFISFFPKLVAGPIERSENLLPQFHRKQYLLANNIIQGSKYVIIGFFMKLVVADRLSVYVDSVYNNVEQHHGITFWIATVCFSFQILCDFAGYSTIAKGVAKYFDYDLMLNFRRPYMALTLSDFWRRWHISLSSWFRDYVYISLGGNRVGKFKRYTNLFVTFLISGLWHGANWTFAIWGAIHGLYLVIENLLGVKNDADAKSSLAGRMAKRVFIFIAVSFAWIFFRANTVSDAFFIIKKSLIINGDIFIDPKTLFYGFIAVLILMGLDIYAEKKGDDNILQNTTLNLPVVLIFSFLVLATLFFGVFDGGQFIYFQF